MKKKLITNLEEELIRARRQGLEEIRERISMRGHGKNFGMDTFSWMAPNFENLSTVIQNFPFPVVWLAKHEQVRCAITYYPEICNRLHSVVIYDKSSVRFKSDQYDWIENIASVGNIEHAVHLLQSLNNDKKILLFSTDENENCLDLNYFREQVD